LARSTAVHTKTLAGWSIIARHGLDGNPTSLDTQDSP
jgi:hypothetical protein